MHAPRAFYGAESALRTTFPLDAAGALAYNGCMLKALGIFVRLVCSLIVLLAVALYLQMPTAVAPESFADAVSAEAVAGLFSSLNWVSITAGVLVLCALLRLLDMAWNVAFCLSSVLVLFCGLWAVWGPVVALPLPVQDNAVMTQLCTLPQTYPVPALIVAGVFAMGWLASTAPFRIAFTTVVSFGLWYGLTTLMHWGIVTRWADTPTPAQPELLAMVLANPWMIAALPGAFFLVYAVLVAFFETFLSSSKKKAPQAEEKPAEDKKPETDEKKPAAAISATPAKSAKPAAALAPKLAKPVLKPATPAAPKPEVKPEPKPEPQPEAKPEEKPETKPEPASAPKPEPKAEEKPAEKAAEPKPEKTEETPAAPEPKPEEKPAEQA